MLTDTALRKLKPKAASYRVADRDGMYITVSKTGTITFRYDYRLNGRRAGWWTSGPLTSARAKRNQRIELWNIFLR